MKKIFGLVGFVMFLILVGLATEKITLARVTTSDRDVWCVGVTGTEVCVDASGNFIPTTTNTVDLGTSALLFKNIYATTVTPTSIVNSGAYTGTTGTFSGQLGLQNISSTTLRTTAPMAAGAQVYCTSYQGVCVGTGTSAGAWIFVGSSSVLGAAISCDL